jgi:hypothetical protein
LRSRTVALACAAAVAPAAAAAEEPPRRRALDLEAYFGALGTLNHDGEEPYRPGPGRVVGGAVVYRALPHLAVGLVADAWFVSIAQGPAFPSASLTTGIVGPTVRGYFRGRGAVDGYVGLAIGPCWLGHSAPQLGGYDARCDVGLQQVVGADIRLHPRILFTPSLAFTLMFGEASSDLTCGPPPQPPLAVPPFATLALRLGWTFGLVQP